MGSYGVKMWAESVGIFGMSRLDFAIVVCRWASIERNYGSVPKKER